MPKATMNKNDFSPGWKHKVWFSGHFPHMKPVTIPQTMDQLTDHHLRFHINGTNPAHVFAAFILGKVIHSIKWPDQGASR